MRSRVNYRWNNYRWKISSIGLFMQQVAYLDKVAIAYFLDNVIELGFNILYNGIAKSFFVTTKCFFILCFCSIFQYTVPTVSYDDHWSTIYDGFAAISCS